MKVFVVAGTLLFLLDVCWSHFIQKVLDSKHNRADIKPAHIHACTHAYTHTTHMHSQTHIHTNRYTHIHMHACTHTHTHVHAHAHTHKGTCMQTCTHESTHPNVSIHVTWSALSEPFCSWSEASPGELILLQLLVNLALFPCCSIEELVKPGISGLLFDDSEQLAQQLQVIAVYHCLYYTSALDLVYWADAYFPVVVKS